MKTSIKVIGILVVVICLIRVLFLAGYGYNENREDIFLFVFISLIGYVFFLFGYHLETSTESRIKEIEMQDAIRLSARKELKEKMKQWDKELTTEESDELNSSKQS